MKGNEKYKQPLNEAKQSKPISANQNAKSEKNSNFFHSLKHSHILLLYSKILCPIDNIRHSIPSLLQNTALYSTLYLLTHHYTLFFILAYASKLGVPHLLLAFLPLAIAQTITSVTYLIYSIVEFDQPLTRYPLLGQMRVQHFFVLGFVYSLGYFAPTIVLVQARSSEKGYMQSFIVANLSYDLVFTVVFSYFLLHRRMLEAMKYRLVLPLILCVIAIILSENVGLYEQGLVWKAAGLQSYTSQERYMYVMSRVCYCFVNVASKLFLFKEQAFQKAWSLVSEQSSVEEFEQELNSFNAINGIDLINEQVPNRERMRQMVHNSPFRAKQKELFDFYSYLCLNMYDLEMMGEKTGVYSQIPRLWDEAETLPEQLNAAYMLEDYIYKNPHLEQIQNNVRRVKLIKNKAEVDKPWTRSNLYLKEKLTEALNTDNTDADIFLNIFRNRDPDDQSSFNTQTKANMAAQDVIFDSFILSDFLTFSSQPDESKILLSILDGIFMLPACILTARLNGTMSVSFLANYSQGLLSIYGNSYGIFSLFFLAILLYVVRPLVAGEIHFTYYRRWVNEPNKMSFLMTVVVVPLGVIVFCPWIDGTDQLSLSFTSGLQLVLSLVAYWLLAEIENQYRIEQLFSICMATFMPLSTNPEMSQRERKFSRKYQFEKQKVQANYCRQIYQDVGIFEFQRLLAKSHALGNLSPMVLNSNPAVDSRELFDDMYHVRTAEWQGFYPSDLQGQIEPVSDQYKDLVYQVCRRRIDIQREQSDVPQKWELEVDDKQYTQAQKELRNNVLQAQLQGKQDHGERVPQTMVTPSAQSQKHSFERIAPSDESYKIKDGNKETTVKTHVDGNKKTTTTTVVTTNVVRRKNEAQYDVDSERTMQIQQPPTLIVPSSEQSQIYKSSAPAQARSDFFSEDILLPSNNREVKNDHVTVVTSQQYVQKEAAKARSVVQGLLQESN